MAVIKPFRGYRPKPELVQSIACPPYDVLSSAEARQMAADNEYSFLHVIKPEIDLPDSGNPYSETVYAKGLENLTKMIHTETLIRELRPSFYVYRLSMGDQVQAGVMAGCSLDEYDDGRIKKHEVTLEAKLVDRTRHMDVMDANTGPVFMTYRSDPKINEIVAQIQTRKSLYDFTAPDGVSHTLWVVSDPETTGALAVAFAGVDSLFIADGHHRSESASRVRALRREKNANQTGDEGYNYFLGVLFPDDQLRILEYNRVVSDLNDHTPDEFLALLTVRFFLGPADAPRPDAPHQFGVFLGTKWYNLRAKPGSFPENDPVASLDVSILTENVLSKILNIKDIRTDCRIHFVGGVRGTKELERLVQSGDYKVAFTLYPVAVSQIIKIADAGLIMPPKSTWFEPKLRSGLVVRMFDE